MATLTFYDNIDNRLVGGDNYDKDDDQHQHQHHHPAAATVRSNYSPENNSYETVARQRAPDLSSRATGTSLRLYVRRKSSNLGQHISHAFAAGAKTNYLFGYLLFFNLLMSILNTVLLSFIVKSVQLNDFAYQLRSGSGVESKPPAPVLAWDEHLEATVLGLPASLTGDKSTLSVQSIESSGRKPLLVQASHYVHPKWHKQPQPEPAADHSVSGRHSNGQGQTEQADEEGAGLGKRQEDEEATRTSSSSRQILISTRTSHESSNNNNYGNEDGNGGDKSRKNHESSASRRPASSYIIVDSDKFQMEGVKMNGPRSGPVDGRPVEIVTDNLVLSSLADNHRADEDRRGGGGKIVPNDDTSSADLSLDNERYLARAVVGSLTSSSRTSRQPPLLQFDGEQRLIVLPLASQISLSPASATALLVGDEFRCQSTISGTLNADLNIQARHGNLTCDSGDLLRLVSRSDKLNLLASQSLTVSVPELSLSAPKTNKVYLADGLEYFDSDGTPEEFAADQFGRRGERQAPTSQQGVAAAKLSTTKVGQLADGSAGLRAYNLVLIDNFLMASSDDEADSS